MAKRGRDKSVAPTSGGSLGGLGDLLAARGLVASPESAVETTPGVEPSPGVGARRAILRRTRKGRGGRTVTLVELDGADVAWIKDLAKRMGKALGCGAKREGAGFIVQGDQVERLQELLPGEGIQRVIVGS